MKTCPRCGYANPDTAALCEDCHKALSAPDFAVAPPPGMSGQPQEPVPLPPPFWTPLRLYLLGIGLGLIPLALWLVGWSASPCSYIYGGLYWPTSGLGGPRDGGGVALPPPACRGACLSGQSANAPRRAWSVDNGSCRSGRGRHWMQRHCQPLGKALLTMVLVEPVVGAIWMQRHRQPATVTALRMRSGGSNVRLEIARAHTGCRGG
jgi:hypothetical protein